MKIHKQNFETKETVTLNYKTNASKGLDDFKHPNRKEDTVITKEVLNDIL